MQVRYVKDLYSPPRRCGVRAVCWSPNGRKLAIADAFGIVHLFDETGEKKDAFQVKSATGQKGGRTYMICGMRFSPDNTKLAVGVSEHIVYVFRLGLNWSQHKTICNRFQQPGHNILSLCWPFLHPHMLVFGREDGEVRLAHLQSHKVVPLYRSRSPVICMVESPDGHGFLSGHYDGSVWRFYFKDPAGEYAQFLGSRKIVVNTSIPTAIGWADTIVVVGADKTITSYAIDGRTIQTIDDPSLRQGREFGCVECNPSGKCFIVSSHDLLRVFNFVKSSLRWEEGDVLEIPGLDAVTGLAWRPDGSSLVVANLNGHVQVYDTCLRRQVSADNQYEFAFVAPSRVIITLRETETKLILKSLYGCEILKLETRSHFLLGQTTRTLILGDLRTCKISEVQWNPTGRERFFFDKPGVCLVHNGTDLSVIEFGETDVTGTFRTDFVSPQLISVRVVYGESEEQMLMMEEEEGEDEDEDVMVSMERRARRLQALPKEPISKVVAYLSGPHTIRITDMKNSMPIARISTPAPHHPIDWLELSYRGTKLLYRDKGGHLYLLDLQTQETKTLLAFCTFVQWVPHSDVVVAQNRGEMCVWYSIDAPERVTVVGIKGEIEGIVRLEECTAVVVNEGTGMVNYALNEGLIEFGAAVEMREYELAAGLLAELTLTPETEAMWKSLGERVMEAGKYHIAERCFAAVGDVAKAKFLRKIVAEALGIVEEEEISLFEAYDHWNIRAQIAVLNGDYASAEAIYLEQGEVELAQQMYERAYLFEESVDLAFRAGLPNAEEKKAKYVTWLVRTQRRVKAGQVYERDGQLIQAIEQYMKAGFPARAARAVEKHVFEGGMSIHDTILTRIAEKLVAVGAYEKAGSFYEKRQMYSRAVECYVEGHCYRSAVELCKERFPDEVMRLEEEWGDWLVSIKQTESAINHYRQSRQFRKAVDAAIAARQWAKAEQILDSLLQGRRRDENILELANRYFVQIGKHYEKVRNFDRAKDFFMKAHEYDYCMDMFRTAGLLEEALAVAEEFLPQERIGPLYIEEAERLATDRRFAEAERLYLHAQEADLAIEMYRAARMYDDMIRLVKQHAKPRHVANALVQVATELESEERFVDAEKYFIEAGDWKKAAGMYKNHGRWQEAIRVAKIYGSTEDAWEEVVWDWATLKASGKDPAGAASGAQLLYRYELYEKSLDFAVDNDVFEFAFRVANSRLQNRIADVHKAYAYYLEERGEYQEAEEHFVRAQFPREAVEMYCLEKDWENAMRVANLYDAALVSYVLDARRRSDEGGDVSEDVSVRNSGRGGGGRANKTEGPKTVVNPPNTLVVGDSGGTSIEVDDVYGGRVEPESPSAYLQQKAADAVRRDTSTSQQPSHEPASDEPVSGNAMSAVLTYCRRGNWHAAKGIVDELPPSSEPTPPQLAFAEHFSTHLLSSAVNDPFRALSVLDQYGAPPTAAMARTYVRLSRHVVWNLGLTFVQIDRLHRLMVKVYDNYRTAAQGDERVNLDEFELWLEIVHLLYMKFLTLKLEMNSLYEKVVVSLLRYTNEIRPVQALYEAGRAVENRQDGNYKNMWAIFFSRVLDIYEHIDMEDEESEVAAASGQSDGQQHLLSRGSIEVDDTSYRGSDIPRTIPLPRQTALSVEDFDNVESQVLCAALAEGGAGGKSLPTTQCDHCGVRDMYFASKTCYNCHHQYDVCAVTGMPVVREWMVECSNCLRKANREDWNTFLMKNKNCPYCDVLQLTQ